jgi:catechol 2,3-dioxygenase-like lactoylglutathione lyase family enzyme
LARLDAERVDERRRQRAGVAAHEPVVRLARDLERRSVSGAHADRKELTVEDWPGGISAITLFMEDLEASKAFYEQVFGLPTVYEDDNSAVFRFGGTLVNLLRATEAPSLVTPATVAAPDAGSRFQLTLGVEDVDATCEDLERRGVELLNGPMDRPWGIRTASFRDPGGHIWEIAR